MSRIPGFLLRHEVVVEPYEGDSAYGPVYSAPVTVPCLLEEGTQLIREEDGHQVASTARFYARLDSVTAPPQSRVTLPSGEQTDVIQSMRHDGGGLATPDHLEVHLKPGRTR